MKLSSVVTPHVSATPRPAAALKRAARDREQPNSMQNMKSPFLTHCAYKIPCGYLSYYENTFIIAL